uniref:Uncharacterized protein n=1 Tax=Siphoviridae sp. ctDsE1 TaxID=2825390 RepID=A0A8S5TYH9_9CAUD|nr:MAG TPA: hypothetical protein [Siphoviridae sp. ctDsE1]
MDQEVTLSDFVGLPLRRGSYFHSHPPEAETAAEKVELNP